MSKNEDISITNVLTISLATIGGLTALYYIYVIFFYIIYFAMLITTL